MGECDTVHRDISVGNILIYPLVVYSSGRIMAIQWKGLLSDWELAKQIGMLARQPHRTVSHPLGISYLKSQCSFRRPGSLFLSAVLIDRTSQFSSLTSWSHSSTCSSTTLCGFSYTTMNPRGHLFRNISTAMISTPRIITHVQG